MRYALVLYHDNNTYISWLSNRIQGAFMKYVVSDSRGMSTIEQYNELVLQLQHFGMFDVIERLEVPSVASEQWLGAYLMQEFVSSKS